MNEQRSILVDHSLSRVVLEGQSVAAENRPRRLSLWLTHLLTLAGTWPLPFLLWLGFTRRFEWSMLGPLLLGVPFVLLGWAFRRSMHRRWGRVVVDGARGSVSWTQGERRIGEWPLPSVRQVRMRISFSSTYRFRPGFEAWLELALEDGTRVPVVQGYPDELEATRRALALIGVPPRA